jgi:glycine cleavage system aminomethyltransferase T
MHGGELLTHEHLPLATTVRSAGYGHTVGRTIFSAYVPTALSHETDFVVDVATQRFPAVRHDGALYDPTGSRVRR